MNMTRMSLATLLFACLSLVAGCKDEKKIAKGDIGESCTRRDDCGGGLSCIDNRCVSESAQAGDGGMMAAGGKAGESCTRRGDCQVGLACIDQVCQAEMMMAGDAGVPSQRGERGETCTARNDCRAGLGCVAGRCRENDYDLTVQPKECLRIECDATADCCAVFVADSSCATLKTECDGGDTFSCSDYAQLCICNQVCEESQCVRKTSCLTKAECGALNCVNQKCVQCTVKTDCFDPAAECIEGSCRKACTHNEECPLFYSCSAGKCTETGCKTSRECFFATDDPRSACVEGECLTPCDTDSECLQDFHVCEQGKCVFVGCENDEECRALIGLENIQGTDKAVCRMPMPL